MLMLEGNSEKLITMVMMMKKIAVVTTVTGRGLRGGSFSESGTGATWRIPCPCWR
jgi:hypothetical protein